MSTRLLWKFFLANGLVNLLAILGLAILYRGEPAFLSKVLPLGALFLGGQICINCWLVSRVVKPLDAVLNSISRMAQGNYADPVYVGVRNRFRKLANDLNVVRTEVTTKSEGMRRLSFVLTAMTDGVIAIDHSQRIQFSNKAAGRLLGFTPTEVEGRPLLDAVRHNKLHELVLRLLASRQQEEIEIKWGDDNLRNLLVQATAFDDGSLTEDGEELEVGIVMMIYNLSEVRRLDAMRRDFVANVSHELKTPLSSIKAYAETLSGGAINDEENRGRFVKQIEEQADRLHQLIADLLSLARIEQGNQLLEIQRVVIAQVVELCVGEQQRAAAERNIELVIIPSDRTAAIEGEEDGLRQILVNLIDNAIKYTPEGGRVSVGWTQEGSETALFVADTGIGIPDEMRERVFERFFRVDKARSREMGGTGLGLAIVKHLSQSYGGSVSVESEIGHGSRFTVRFPRP